jgi:hypothetical protein
MAISIVAAIVNVRTQSVGFAECVAIQALALSSVMLRPARQTMRETFAPDKIQN